MISFIFAAISVNSATDAARLRCCASVDGIEDDSIAAMPTHTTFGSLGAMAMTPMERVIPNLSKTASQLVPLFLLREAPLAALNDELIVNEPSVKRR